MNTPTEDRAAVASFLLRYFLAFTVIWFGWNEIWSPGDWTVFVPSFLGLTQDTATALVAVHGVLLCIIGLALVLKYKVRIASGLLALMFLEITADLIISNGFSDIVVRDIGLMGMAIGLSIL
ncbi:MAG: hypothetical protein KGI49_02145 [Patescibacteria group bacterium]|nr:hypothetical protein [Patescibacteria group bacterium]